MILPRRHVAVARKILGWRCVEELATKAYVRACLVAIPGAGIFAQIDRRLIRWGGIEGQWIGVLPFVFMTAAIFAGGVVTCDLVFRWLLGRELCRRGIVLITGNWNPANERQAEDRLRRSGEKS